MHVPMTAPQPTSNYADKKRHASYQMPAMGIHPAILYSMVDLGTQNGEYEGKPTKNRKIILTFELPFHHTYFWEDDTQPRPFTASIDYTYAMTKNKKGKKSNFLQMIEGLYGPIAESQYLTFDVSQLLDGKYMINLQHYIKKDGSNGIKITQISPVNPNFVDPARMVRVNELVIYSIQAGFDGMAFAKLLFWMREKIKESDQGQAHLKAGGKFSKLDENGNLVFEDSGVAAPAVQHAAPQMGAVAAPSKRLVWLSPQYTYDQLKATPGWTDDLMVQHGYARWEEVAPPASPAPQLPPPPAYQQAPPVQQPVQPLQQQPVAAQIPPPPAPVAAAPVQTVLVATNPAYDLNAMQAQGWTKEQLVTNGYAIEQAAPGTAAVATPPASPVATPPPYVPPAADPVTMFTTTPAAPVTNVTAPTSAVPPPPAPAPAVQTPPPPQGFNGAPVPPPAGNGEEHDDLPF